MFHRCRPGQLFLFWLLATAACLSAQEAATTDTIPIPVYSGSDYLGEIAVQFSVDDVPFVRPLSLVELLEDLVVAGIADAVRARYTEPVWVSLEEISQFEFTVQLDWESLAIIVDVPPSGQRPQTILLSGYRREPRGTRVYQAPFSLVANVDLWGRYNYEGDGFEASLTPDLAVNVMGAVLELKGGVRTEAPVLFLDHARFVWDFQSIGYRIEAGDLSYRRTELEDVNLITGVSFFRHNPLLPHSVPGGAFVQQLTVSEAVELTIAINENRTKSWELDPGNYLFSGFPLVGGINTVLISWMAADGPREVELILPSDAELLDSGQFDAGIAAGIADRSADRPVVASYQALGLTDFFTVRFREGIEPIVRQGDIGIAGLVATRFGTISLSPDLSLGPDGRFVLDIPVSYRYLDSRPSSYRSFGVTLGLLAARADSAALTQMTFSGSGFLNLAFAQGFSITPRLNYSFTPVLGGHTLQVRAGLRKSIMGGSSIAADVGFVYDVEPGFVAAVTYSAAFPERQQNLFLQQDLDAGRFSGYWSRYAGDRTQDVDMSVSAGIPTDFDESLNLGGQFGYTNPYLRVSASHAYSGVINQNEHSNATSVRAQTAIVAVKGQTAITAPVLDSFVIIAPGDSTAELPLRVNRTAAGADLEILGRPRVLSNVSPYAPTEIVVEPEELLLGSESKELRYYVIPGYRSGTLITVDLERNIYVGGVLAQSDETVLPYQFGTWRRLPGPVSSGEGARAPEAEPRAEPESGEFFTDENGYFEIYNVRPGSFELQLVQQSGLRFVFVVPEDAGEFYDLETVTAEAGK